MRKSLIKYVSRFFLVCTVVAVMAASFIPTTTVFAIIGDGASGNIQLLDTNTNGLIDQINFDIANPNAETWSLNGAMPYGLSVTQNGAPVTISNVVISSAPNANPVVIQVVLVEGTVVLDTDGVGTNPVELIYSPAGYGSTPNIQDSADEELTAIATGDTGITDTEIDLSAPIILSREAEDGNTNGKIDTIEFICSENLNDNFTGFTTADITITGYTVNAVNTGTTGGDNIFEVGINEIAGTCNFADQSGCDTASAPNTQITTNTTLGDNNVSLIATDAGTVASDDEATPIGLGGAYLDNDNDGQIDQVEVIFSENVTYTYQDSDWTPTVNGLTSFDVSGCDSCTNVQNLLLTATAQSDLTGVSGGAEPDLAYAAGNNIQDQAAAPNNAYNFTLTGLADSAAPQIIDATSSTPDDIYGPGTAIDVSLSFTESVNSVGLSITLDNGVTVVTGALVNQSSFSGNIYTVGVTGSGEDSSDLSIASVVGSIDDGIQSTVNPAIPVGSNIADTSDIVIDTTAPQFDGLGIIPVSLQLTDANIGASAVTIRVYFNETMDTSVDPVISFEMPAPPNPSGLSSSGTAWGFNLVTDDRYTEIYDLSDSNEDMPNIDINITLAGVTDLAGNLAIDAIGMPSVDAFSIDTQNPTVTAPMLFVDPSFCTGTAGTCIIGDTIYFSWDNTAGGDANTDEDPTLVIADLTNFDGLAAQQLYDDGTNGDFLGGDDLYTYAYTVPAGTRDGSYSYLLTVTDLVGNVTGPVTSPPPGGSIDNEVPIVTAGCISVTGATGTAGTFKYLDTPAPTWADIGCDNNTDTIANVVFDASDFRALDTAVAGVDSAGIWVGTIAGLMDDQDDTNNNTDVIVTDDAGNTTTVSGTNNYDIDTELPGFTAVQTVEALMQGGGAPSSSTNIWYYYPGQDLELQLNNAAETDGNDLLFVKACIRSMEEDVPSQVCSPADFAGPAAAKYTNLTINAGFNSATLDFALAGLLAGYPTYVDGYQMNFELEDDAGNIWQSANAAEYFFAAFNVVPQDIYTGTPDIDNLTTTDWSTITDFTAATNIVFNANDGVNDVGRITITGPLNLTTTTAINELQTLAANMTVTGDQGTGAIDAKIDSANLSIFDTGATIMIRVPSAIQPGIVVRDDADAIVGYVQSGDTDELVGGDNLTGITWDGVSELTFTTDGFSSFGGDQTVPTETITPANASTGVATTTPIVVTFSEEMDTSTFAYTLLPNPGGTAVVWSAGDTVATISHTAFANSTSYTLTVTGGDDMVGNSTAGSASTFTTVAASSGGGGGGSAGGRAITTTTPTTETTPTESYEAPLVFSDVAGHWAEDYIYEAKDGGYIIGYEDETFRPDQNITRSEAAKLIAMWMDSTIGDDECEAGLFSDVDCSLWYAKYVTYLHNADIIEGYGDGTFGPGNYINRAEALKMMLFAKAIQNSSIADVVNPFSDVSMNNWFYNYVMVGYKLSIVQGYEDGTFGPGKNITRAEFTKIFVETLMNN